MDRVNGGREGQQYYMYILPLTSPIFCFNSLTVQPNSPLISLGGATSPVDKSTTDIIRLIPTPSNICTCNLRHCHSNHTHLCPCIF